MTRDTCSRRDDSSKHCSLNTQLHSLGDALPSGDEAPEGQSAQAPEPVTTLYLPATHDVQGPPSGPVEPLLHAQDARDALPATEVVFAGQPVQTPDLFAAAITENLPAGQLVHTGDPIAENLPAGQLVHTGDPIAENLPAGQLVQTPPAVEDLPAAQSVQSLKESDPAGEDVPAAHAEQ